MRVAAAAAARILAVTGVLVGLGLAGSAASALAAAPTVLGLSPLDGSTAGGTTVTIYGQGFVAGATTVAFGSTAATSVTVSSSSQLTAVTPAGAAGAVDATVTTSGGTSTTSSADRFTFGPGTPSGLQANAVGATQVALSWTPPAIAGVTGYTVYRNGTQIATTDRYTPNYLDTGLSPGAPYSYTVTAQTASGSTAASAALPITTAAAASETTLAGPQCPTTPLSSGGTYILTGNLATSSGSCLASSTTGSTSNVTIDCQGHSIATSAATNALSLENVSHFLIVNCKLTAPSNNVYQWYFQNTSFGTVANNQLGTSSSTPEDLNLNISGGSNLVVAGNTFTNGGFEQASVTNGYVGANTFSQSSTSATESEPLASILGADNMVVDNNINGDATSANELGADDGMELGTSSGAENDDVVANNSIQNVYDAGIEALGMIANTTISNNTIKSAYYTGFGEYYNTSLVDDTIANNTITQSPDLFQLYTALFEPGPTPTQYLLDNVISGNVLSQPNSSRGTIPAADEAPWTTPPPAAVVAGGNVLSNNNFGTTLSAPQFDPTLSFVGTASNNVCQETAAASGTEILGCPAVTGFSPANGPVAGGTTITITGSGFKTDGPVVSVTVGGIAATNVTVTSDTSLTATVPAAAGGASGLASIVVTTRGTTGEVLPALASPSTQFAYTKTPVVTGVSVPGQFPAEGPVGGGTSVTITGSGFTGATAVHFHNAGASFTVNSDTSITAISPPGSDQIGYGDITVTGPSGTSAITTADQFVWGPSISSVSPSSGPVTGGTLVTITGTGFESDGGIYGVGFNQGGATSFTVVSDTEIQAVTEPCARGCSGPVQIVLTTSGVSGQETLGEMVDPGVFSYVPVVSSVTVPNQFPAEGPVGGGTSVTITGSGFTGATAVHFHNAGASFTVNSNTSITAVSPPGSDQIGYGDITVTTPSGTSAISTADQFVWGPSITSISPTSGPKAGGTLVTITGTGFDSDGGVYGVGFNQGGATSFTVVSDTEIQAVTEPCGKGCSAPVQIVLTTSGVTGQETLGEMVDPGLFQYTS